MRSTLEHEVRLRVAFYCSEIRAHDRGVVIGLALAAVPLPPVALAGLLISLANLRLLAMGRLVPRERRLVHIALAVGIVSLFLGCALFGGLAFLILRVIQAAIGLGWATTELLLERLLALGGAVPLSHVPLGLRRI